MDKWAIMLNLMQSTPQTQVNQFAPAEYPGSFQTPDLQDAVEAGQEAGRAFRGRRFRKQMEKERKREELEKKYGKFGWGTKAKGLDQFLDKPRQGGLIER